MCVVQIIIIGSPGIQIMSGEQAPDAVSPPLELNKQSRYCCEVALHIAYDTTSLVNSWLTLGEEATGNHTPRSISACS